MPSFLTDIKPFYGTGNRNAKGQTLEEFLDAYDPYKYQTPSVTVDNLIFWKESEDAHNLDGMKVLLIRRKNHPCIGLLALPGGFVEMREDLETAALRELQEETGVTGLEMEQLAVYGDYERDPRTRVVTTAFMTVVCGEQLKVEAADDAADALWADLTVEKIGEECLDEQHFRELFTVKVVNEAKSVSSVSKVERVFTRGLIRAEKYRVIEQDQVACDHAAIICHGYEELRKRV